MFDAWHDALVAAAARGDVPALAQQLASAPARANVDLWNELHGARLRDERIRVFPTEPAWFVGDAGSNTIFEKCLAGDGQPAVLRWLFSGDGVAICGNTLRCVTVGMVHTVLSRSFVDGLELFEILVESRIFVDAMEDAERRDVLGSALHMAASRGDNDWVDLLLAYGADPNHRHNGRMPISALDCGGDLVTMRLLLDHGAWVLDERVLKPYADGCNDKVFATLLELGADANEEIIHNRSLLHYAVRFGGSETIKILLSAGCPDLDKRDENGRTALTLALENRHENKAVEMAQILLEHGADADVLDASGRRIIGNAVRRGWTKLAGLVTGSDLLDESSLHECSHSIQGPIPRDNKDAFVQDLARGSRAVH